MFDVSESSYTSIAYKPSKTYYKSPTGSRKHHQPTNPDLWAYKPMWCQPWSIILSGIALVAGVSYVAGGHTIATVLAAVPILFWWYVSLGLVPRDFRRYADNQKNKTKKKKWY